MPDIKLQVLAVTCLLAFSCTGAAPSKSSCKKPMLSRHEVITIIEEEVHRQGGELKAGRQSRIEISRDGCGYLYREIFLPERPGDFLIARLNEDGKVLDLFAGH